FLTAKALSLRIEKSAIIASSEAALLRVNSVSDTLESDLATGASVTSGELATDSGSDPMIDPSLLSFSRVSIISEMRPIQPE
ncbi:MAG: hypothetical protein ABJF23_33685, partial [Bryobacteraceae bacterium]